jgi:hypothetical protein
MFAIPGAVVDELPPTLPPAYDEVPSTLPPAYSDAPGEDLVAQMEQMKAMMKKLQMEKEEIMWKMHLQKEEMMDKMEKMRLAKEAMVKGMATAAKEAMAKQVHSVSSLMRMHTEKKKKEFIAEEKHWSSDFDSWDKRSKHPQCVRSIVSAFLATIPTETVYAIHSICLKEYGNGMAQYPPPQYSQLQTYIATDSKVYMMHLNGDINGNYRTDISGAGVFKEIVTFPSDPTPTFWRAVFSQMGEEDIEFTSIGHPQIYRVANAKLEALFKSFR